MEQLIAQVFALPPELLLNCVWDVQTLVRLQLAALSRRDEPRFLLLDQQWKKMGGKTSDVLQELINLQGIPGAEQLIDWTLRPYTLQRQIRELFESGMYVRGYLLFKTLPRVGNIVTYILDKYFPLIFRARVELKEWDMVRENLKQSRVVWQAFEVYRTLNHEQQQELRSKLDDQENLLFEFLVDSEGTEVDEWTDKLIKDWLTASPLRDPIIAQLQAPMINSRGRKTTLAYQVDAIRNLLYFSHGDPRYQPGARGFNVIPGVDLSNGPGRPSTGVDLDTIATNLPPGPLVGGPFAQMTRNMQISSHFETRDAILVSFRGREEDFERLFLQVVRDSAGAYLREERGIMGLSERELLERIHDTGRRFILSNGAELPFYQYPNLVEKYERYITFNNSHNLSPATLEKIFDLIDYQDHLQALQLLVEQGRRENPRLFDSQWILENYGVRL